MSADEFPATPRPETDAEFLARLRSIATDHRFSAEFLGLVVRSRYPAEYPLRDYKGRLAARSSSGTGTGTT